MTTPKNLRHLGNKHVDIDDVQGYLLIVIINIGIHSGNKLHPFNINATSHPPEQKTSTCRNFYGEECLTTSSDTDHGLLSFLLVIRAPS